MFKSNHIQNNFVNKRNLNRRWRRFVVLTNIRTKNVKRRAKNQNYFLEHLGNLF